MQEELTTEEFRGLAGLSCFLRTDFLRLEKMTEIRLVLCLSCFLLLCCLATILTQASRRTTPTIFLHEGRRKLCRDKRQSSKSYMGVLCRLFLFFSGGYIDVISPAPGLSA